MKDASSERARCEHSFCSGAASLPQQLLPIVEMLLRGEKKPKKHHVQAHPDNLTTHADDIYAEPCVRRVREIKDKVRNKAISLPGALPSICVCRAAPEQLVPVPGWLCSV